VGTRSESSLGDFKALRSQGFYFVLNIHLFTENLAKIKEAPFYGSWLLFLARLFVEFILSGVLDISKYILHS
jgi:hypothetical protein